MSLKVPDRTDYKLALELLRQAAPHVARQKFAGKHEQDRSDALKLDEDIRRFFKENANGLR